jgi:hypothetical protein
MTARVRRGGQCCGSSPEVAAGPRRAGDTAGAGGARTDGAVEALVPGLLQEQLHAARLRRQLPLRLVDAVLQVVEEPSLVKGCGQGRVASGKRMCAATREGQGDTHLHVQLALNLPAHVPQRRDRAAERVEALVLLTDDLVLLLQDVARRGARGVRRGVVACRLHPDVRCGVLVAGGRRGSAVSPLAREREPGETGAARCSRVCAVARQPLCQTFSVRLEM